MSKYYDFPCFASVNDACKAAEAYAFMQKHRDLFRVMPESDEPQPEVRVMQPKRRYLAEEYNFLTDESNV